MLSDYYTVMNSCQTLDISTMSVQECLKDFNTTQPPAWHQMLSYLPDLIEPRDRTKLTTWPFHISNYATLLLYAEKTIQSASHFIHLISDNDSDGLLDLLTKNLQDIPNTAAIRIISLNRECPNRFRNNRNVTLAKARNPSPDGLSPLLISDGSILQYKLTNTELRNLAAFQQTPIAEFYYRSYGPELDSAHNTFDTYWQRLTGEKLHEKPKSKLSRILDIMFE